jgi:hypothetical protein
LWVSNKSIHQSKPRLRVTNTRYNIITLTRIEEQYEWQDYTFSISLHFSPSYFTFGQSIVLAFFAVST